jgi:3-deoxy-7-phosphoheptulonate synthase
MVDPSHATFWSPWVAPLAKAAIVAGADTIMIEVHPTPRNAWVDPLQAIDYQEFTDLMSEMDLVAKAVGKQVL